MPLRLALEWTSKGEALSFTTVGAKPSAPAVEPTPSLPVVEAALAVDLAACRARCWSEALDARRLVMEEGISEADKAKRNAWVGGVLKAISLVTGEDLEALHSALAMELPWPAYDLNYGGIPVEPPHETERPEPPPGAAKPVEREVLLAEQKLREWIVENALAVDAGIAVEVQCDHDILKREADNLLTCECGRVSMVEVELTEESAIWQLIVDGEPVADLTLEA